MPHAPIFPPLPLPLSPLIGRETERAELARLLRAPGVRLVTLLGPGGAGKTRLALAVADELGPGFPGGAGFVSLAPLPSSGDPLAVLSAAAGLAEGEGSALDALAAVLTDRPALLVLDNFEHLTGSAPAIAGLLARCPGTKVLATSQVALRLRGEREFPLGPLRVPDPAAPPATLVTEPAVALFLALARVDRARLVRTDDDLRAIAAVCRQLDGLPLAIELAAARAAVLPPRALLAKLQSRLGLLTGGPRDLPERHQTLRATIGWSYHLLAPGAQALFRALALLPGGADLQTVDAVGAHLGTPPAEGLAALIDHSLLRAGETPAGEPRYTMLATIREFGVEAATDLGERNALEHALAGYVAASARAAAAGLAGPEQAAHLAWLAAEADNLRAAVEWLLAAGDDEEALQVGAALGRCWLLRGQFGEGRRTLDALLTRTGTDRSPARAAALTALGALAEEAGDHAAALAAHTESLELSRTLGDAYGIARAVNNRGLVQLGQRDYAAARASFEEALKAFRALGNESAVGVTLINLARVADRTGDEALAQGLLERALAVQRKLGDSQRVALTLQTLGLVATARGELDRADASFREAIALWEGLEDADSVARTLAHRGRLARLRGDEGAAALLAQGIERAASLEDDRLTLAMCCLDLAVIAWQRGEREVATRLLGQADALHDWRAAPLRPDERADWERAESALRGALDKPVFAALHAEGAGLGPDWALGVARRFAAEPAAPPAKAGQDGAAPFGLSARELDVARLLIQGLSDKQIGDELFISHRTVMRHVTNILAKMEVPTRTAAAALAVRHGLG